MQTRTQNSAENARHATSKPTRIVLTGFMGAGKTTVGRMLAERLGWTFVDLDDVIVETAGESIATLFAEYGEAEFRERERAALDQVLAVNEMVLALGGGALETEANRVRLRASSGTRVIFLEAPLGVLLGRCEDQQRDGAGAARPILADPALLERYTRRLPQYRAAHHTLTTAGSEPTEIVEKILTEIFVASNSNSPS